MNVSKSVGIFLLVAVAGALSFGIRAQNSMSGAAATGDALPKDVYPDSRNRLPLPRHDDFSGEEQKLFDAVNKPSELPVGIEQPEVREWDPKLGYLLSKSGHYLKYETGLPNPLVEIAVLTAARENDCQYEWTQWETHGRDPKDPRLLDPKIIDIIKYEKPVVGLGEKETAIIKLGRETFGDRYVTPETFAEVLRLFGRKGTVDVLWLMANYGAASAELIAFDNHLRADQKPLMPPVVHKRNPLTFTASYSNPLPKDVYPDSRNRLPMPKREDFDAEGQKIFDYVTRGKPMANGEVPSGFLPTGTPQADVRLWAPRLAMAQSDAGHYLKYDTGLPNRLLEIAILQTAYELECQYEWTQWERFGRNPKDPRHIEDSLIDLIKYNKPVVGIGEKEAAIIKFSREDFGDRKVSSETFAEVLRLFGRKGTVDLLWVMANYSTAAAELTAFDQQLQPGQTPLLPAR